MLRILKASLIALAFIVVLGFAVTANYIAEHPRNKVNLLLKWGFDSEWVYYTLLSPAELAELLTVRRPSYAEYMKGSCEAMPHVNEWFCVLDDNPLTVAVRRSNEEYDLLEPDDGIYGLSYSFELHSRPFRITYRLIEIGEQGVEGNKRLIFKFESIVEPVN